MHSSNNKELFTVASYNILIDKTRSSYEPTHPEYIAPQHNRVGGVAATIGGLLIRPDVVMLQELHITKNNHNGEYLQERLGYSHGVWAGHNEDSRKNEYLGIMADRVDDVLPAIDIGDNRKAVAVRIGETVFVNLHLRSGTKKQELRRDQMNRIMDAVKSYDQVVIAGDANSHSKEPARLLMRKEGFHSAFRAKGRLPLLPGVLPATFPSSFYRDIRLTNAQSSILRTGISIDIIETRGIRPQDVVATSVVDSSVSDHRLISASIKRQALHF